MEAGLAIRAIVFPGEVNAHQVDHELLYLGLISCKFDAGSEFAERILFTVYHPTAYFRQVIIHIGRQQGNEATVDLVKRFNQNSGLTDIQ